MKSKSVIILMVLLIVSLSASPILAQEIADMGVSLLRYNPSPAQPGQIIDLFFEVSNRGDITKDAWLEIIPEYPYTLLQTEDSTRAKNLGTLSSTQTLQFRVKIDEQAKDGITPLKVRFGADKTLDYSQEKLFDIDIQTFDARISIDSIEQTPKELVPGKKGDVTITITNNDDKPLRNVDVLFDMTQSYDINMNMNNMISVQAMINARLEEVNRRVASGLSPLKGATPMMNSDSGMSGEMGQKSAMQFTAIAPAETTTQKRINTLGPGETVEVSFAIQAMPDAQPNIYAIPIYINYNDEDNNPFHTSTEIPVLVNMEPEVLVELKSTTLRSTDFAGEVVIVVANTGLSDLRYASLELQESEHFTLLTAPKTVYLGNLGPGESAEGVFTIIADTEDLVLPVDLTFRDSFNEKISTKRQLKLDIINRNYYRDLPFEMWLAWIILGLVILMVTMYYVKNMTKKKRHH